MFLHRGPCFSRTYASLLKENAIVHFIQEYIQNTYKNTYAANRKTYLIIPIAVLYPLVTNYNGLTFLLRLKYIEILLFNFIENAPDFNENSKINCIDYIFVVIIQILFQCKAA